MYRFLYAHGQSSDWVLWGDPTCMITRLADGTVSRQRPHRRLGVRGGWPSLTGGHAASTVPHKWPLVRWRAVLGT
jgi:hypothetical protein